MFTLTLSVYEPELPGGERRACADYKKGIYIYNLYIYTSMIYNLYIYTSMI